jgi:dipeptidyl-peptidase-4
MRWPNFPKQFAETKRFALGRIRNFTLSPESNKVFFLKNITKNNSRLGLFSLSIDSEQITCLVDPSQLIVKDEDFLPKEEKARRERLRESGSGITNFSVDDLAKSICFSLNGELWYLNLVDSKVTQIDIPGPIIDPRISPDGKHIAGVINSGLFIYSIEKKEGKFLIENKEENVTYGLVDFISAEELNRYRGFWWNKESTSLVVERVDENNVELVNLADPTNPQDPVRTHRYPFAGTNNPSCDFFVVDLKGNLTKLEFNKNEFEYVTDVDFISANKVNLTLLSRDQKNMVLREFDLSSNKSTDLWSKTHPYWVEVEHGSPKIFEDHLVVIDGEDKRQLFIDSLALTSKDIEVRNILNIDKDGIFLQISSHQNSSALMHVDWKGNISEVGSQNSFVTGSRKGHLTLIIEQNEKNWYRKITVSDGKKTIEIKEDQQQIEFNPRIEFFDLGENKISTALILPTWYENDKKLPVIFAPYGGPHFANCLKNASLFLTDQWLADQGYAVIVADNRGTPGRGKNWEYEIFENWSEKILKDQITVMDELNKKFPNVLNLEKVGITGWSFGGYFAALAVLDAPERFHAAIAGAPVTDMRWYDTAYSERYLGNPNIDSKKYDDFSLINKAEKLTRPLLIIHGLADDNVLATHSLKFSQKLLSHAKLHEFLPLSGVSHMTPQEVITENLLKIQLDFFNKYLN